MHGQPEQLYLSFLSVIDSYKLWEFEEKKQQERQRDPLALIITACIENLYTKDKHISVKIKSLRLCYWQKTKSNNSSDYDRDEKP